MLPSTTTAMVSQSPSLRTMPSAPRAQLIGAMFAPAQIHICCGPVESLSASGMGSMLWTSTLSSAPASVAMIAPWPPVGVRSRRVVRLEQRPARHLRGVAVGPTPRRARRHHHRRDTAPATETLSTRTARRTLRNLQAERRETGELRGPLGRGERSVGLRPPVAVQLPHVADFQDLIEVEVRHHDLVPIARGLRGTPAARIAKIALAVELADVPWLLVADPVDGADEVAVGHRVGRLLQLPQIFGEPRHGRRRVEDDLGPGQPQRARALGEVAVITDVDTDRPHPRS